MIDTRTTNLSENVAKTPRNRTLADTSTAFSNSVEKRLKQVSPAFHAAVMSFDAELDLQLGSPGPVDSELSIQNPGKVLSLVAGAYAGLSGISTSTTGRASPSSSSRPGEAWDSHWAVGGPSSCPTAAGTPFSIPTNPVLRRPGRPIRTTERPTLFTTTPTPLAMGVGL